MPKISALTALLKANVDAVNDYFPIVDADAGATKKISVNNLPITSGQFNLPNIYYVGTNGHYATLADAVTALNSTSPYTGAIILMPGTHTLSAEVAIYNNCMIMGYGPRSSILDIDHTGAGVRFSLAKEIWQAGTVYAAGEYVLPTAPATHHDIRYRCTVGGTSGGGEPVWNEAYGATTADNTCLWTCVPWPNPIIRDLSVLLNSAATDNGIIFDNTQFCFVKNIYSYGGNANIWHIKCNATMQSTIDGVRLTGNSNGIFLTTDDWTTWTASIGDSAFRNIDITLNAANTVGMAFKGSNTTSGNVNNVLCDRIEIAGTGLLADVQVGIWLENSQRLTFNHIDIENINCGILELSEVGSGGPQVSLDNKFHRVHFLPAGAQTEAHPYLRGAPLQTGHATGTANFVVRSAWLTLLGITSGDLKIGMDDTGIYSRSIQSISSDTPSAGLSTITTTVNLNVDMTTARNSCLSKGNSFPVRTSYWGNGSGTGLSNFYKSAIQLPGTSLIWQDQNLYQSIIAKWLSAGHLGLRSERSATEGNCIGGIIFDVGAGGANANPDIYPEKAGEILSLGANGKQTVRYLEVSTATGARSTTLTEEVILATAAAGYSLTLPQANTAEGKQYIIKKTDDNGNVITIDGYDAETIDGAATYTGLSAQYKYVHIYCDGTAWHVIGSN